MGNTIGQSQDADRWRHFGVVLLLIACIAHLTLVIHFQFTQDDAYITFRYAANYLDGNGLVYNAGERVEGYTNFLWVILMILGGLLGIDFVVLSKILGSFFGIGNLMILYLFAKTIFADLPQSQRSTFAGACCLLTGTAYSFAYWATAGLETAAFSFMALGSLYLYVRRSLLTVPALVIATLLRPEGVLIYLFIFAYETISRRSITRTARTIHILYIIFLVPHLFFKLLYYYTVLPNPFYAKTNFGLQQVINGMSYSGQFFYHYLAAGLWLVPVLIIFRRTPRALKIVAAFLILYTAYIIVIGGDVLKVHRFFVPLMPLFILAAVYGIQCCFNRKSLIIAGLSAMLIWQIVVPYNHVNMFHDREIGLAKKLNRLMDKLLSADQSNFSIAVSTIGLVGYRLHGHTVIDLLGLTDSTIARHPEPAVEEMETTWRENKYNSAYVLSRQPDYILFSTGIKASAPAERALFLYSKFLGNYRTVPFYYSGKLQQVFKRYGLAIRPIERDVDFRFEQYYHRGIELWNKGKYTSALSALEKAKEFSPSPTYPYLNYFVMLIHKSLRNFSAFRMTLNEIISTDTLVIEAYEELYHLEKSRGNEDKAVYYRQRIKSLAPWYEQTLP